MSFAPRCSSGSIALAALALLLAGCPSGTTKPPPAAAPKVALPMTLLVVDDPQLGQAIAREWRARTEEDLQIQNLSAAEAEKAGRLPGDAVVFPVGMVGQFIEKGLIQQLSDVALEDAEFAHRDIFTPLRMDEMRWGNRTVAVPLGSPRLLLAYRGDIFDKLQLQPPNNWTEYQQLVERLADRSQLGELAPPQGQAWHAAIEPLADGWAGQLLLARAAAYALHRDQVSPLFKFDSLEPLIAEPPYRRALEELIAVVKAGGFATEKRAPDAALAELLAGRTAMAITWPAPNAAKAEITAGTIRFAMLPGSADAYNFGTKFWDQRSVDEPQRVPLVAISGRMGAVTSSSADPQRAEGFLVWLAGREASSLVAVNSSATTLFRTSQVASPARWASSLNAEAAGQYAGALAQTMELPRSFPGLRLPGRSEYLAALDKSVQQATAGEKSADDALAEAVAAWREITKAHVTAEQQRANARSLGQQSL